MMSESDPSTTDDNTTSPERIDQPGILSGSSEQISIGMAKGKRGAFGFSENEGGEAMHLEPAKKSRASSKYLLVNHDGRQTQISITTMICLGDLQKGVKEMYPITASPIFIQFRTDKDDPTSCITKWAGISSLPHEYFEEDGKPVFIHVDAPFTTAPSMSSKYLLVNHDGRQTQINITTMICLGDLQKGVKEMYPITASPIFIQFRTDKDDPTSCITKWAGISSLPHEYFEEDGKPVFIHVDAPFVTTTAPSVQELSGSLETETSNLNNFALRDYLALGVLLKDDAAVLAIADCLKTIVIKEYREEIPFVYLESSSGLGKSQTAFALIPALPLDAQVFYFLYSIPDLDTQPVYRSFFQISKVFNACIERDSSHYRDVSPTVYRLIDQQLYVFGFIKVLLQQFNKSNALEIVKGAFVVQKMHGGELSKFIKDKYPSTDCKPTFIIDECNLKKEQVEKFRFVRNVFRCLGTWLVMLGTDSQAAQLGDSRGTTSRRGDPFVWCHVFNKLPCLYVPSLRLPTSLGQDICSLITKSRPWFAHLAAKYWTTTPDPSLDGLLEAVYSVVVERKRIFHTEFGKLGQIHLFQNTSFVADNSSPLIHEHFGQLDAIHNFTLNNWMCFAGTKKEWVPSAIFPLVENDPLLFLSLMGGPRCPAFVIASNRVPYSYYIFRQIHSVAARQYSVNLRNAVQTANDRTEFESRLTACICLASHSGGVHGVSVEDFLQDLIYNLHSVAVPTSVFRVNLTHQTLSSLQGYRVPFLSPPNSPWPRFVKSCGNFANLWRAKNMDMIDILTSCKLSAEVKDWTAPLSTSVLAEIILRTPIDSKLHIVLVRKLQKTNFSTVAYAAAVRQHSERFAVCKVDLGSAVLEISEIGGIPIPISPSGVILFILCPE